MNQILNDTQRKLVEDNHNLIYSFLKDHKLGLNDTEDWYGIAATGLCNAACVFDASRGNSFSTLAYKCMENEVRREKKKQRKNVTEVLNLDSEVSEEYNCSLADIIQDPDDFTYGVYINDSIKTALGELSDRDRLILRLIIGNGMTHEKVAQHVGLSRPYVTRVYRAFISKVKHYNSEL